MSLKVFKHISDAQKWNGVGNINNAIDSLIEAVVELSKGSAAAAPAPSVMMGAALDETHEPSVWPTVQTDSEEVRALKREFEALGGDFNREVSIPTPVTAQPPVEEPKEEAKEEPVAEKPAPKKPTRAK